MAYILTNGKTYTDKSGAEHSTAYAAIDDIINCKRKKEATVILKIFASKDAANEGKEPFETNSLVVKNWTEQKENTDTVEKTREIVNENGETVTETYTEELKTTEEVPHNDYNDYMSPQAVTEDDNSFKRAYSYFDDKNISLGGFMKDNWQADE